MPSFMPISTQYNEMFHIWFFSVVSTLVGCFIMYIVSSETYQPAYAAIGFAHLISFLPAMIYSEQRWFNIVTSSVLCILFPIWGAIVGMMCMGVGAPVVCSLLWGIVLASALRRPSAVLVMLVVGLISNAMLFFPVELVPGKHGSDIDGQFATTIYTWYIAMLFAIPLIMSSKVTPPVPKHTGENICHSCGYCLDGLEHQSVCPECGNDRKAVSTYS
jgi:hypothetical protein